MYFCAVPTRKHHAVLPRGIGASLLLSLALGPGLALNAQTPTGTLLVTVRVDSVPLRGAFVRSGRTGGVSDATGVARLELAAGLTRVVVSHPGYQPWSFEITIVPEAQQRVAADLTPAPPNPHGLVAESARSDRSLEDEPTPVSVVTGQTLGHLAQIHPASLAALLEGLPGVRAQTLSGPLGATRYRIRGLRGQYADLRVDGLPLFGGALNSFRLPQLAPLDLERAEVLPGAASALYGSSALSGLVNLVSRRADRDTARLALNQSSEKGGGAVFWGARRFGPTSGATLMAEVQQQRLVDADDDQWAEFPRVIRVSARPRLFLDRPNGDALMVTLGAMSEDRTGGFLLSNTDPDPYREELRTRRFDGGLRATRRTSHTGRVDLRLSAMTQSTAHRFDDLRERDRRSTLFAEAAWTDRLGGAVVLAGAAWQRDAFSSTDVPGFDYTYSVPGVFGQVSLAAGRGLTALVAGRCDAHNVFGLFCTPRASLLVHPDAAVRARVTVAGGYYAPGLVPDDAEVFGLRALVPVAVNFERGQTTSLDLDWTHGRLSAVASVSFSRVTRPVRLIPLPGDTGRRLRAINVDEPTRVAAADLHLAYRADPIVVAVFYGYLHGTEGIPGGTGRRESDLTPRHRLGSSLMWQGAAIGPWFEVRASYTGPQFVWDNPYRTRTPGYGVVDAVASQPMGRARLYLSGQNLFDIKQRSYEPLLLPEPAAGGRRTTTPWMPLQGRVIRFGAVLEW